MTHLRHLTQSKLEVPQLGSLAMTINPPPSSPLGRDDCGAWAPRVSHSGDWPVPHLLQPFFPFLYHFPCSFLVFLGSNFHINGFHSLPCLKIWGMPCVWMAASQDGGASISWVPRWAGESPSSPPPSPVYLPQTLPEWEICLCCVNALTFWFWLHFIFTSWFNLTNTGWSALSVYFKQEIDKQEHPESIPPPKYL